MIYLSFVKKYWKEILLSLLLIFLVLKSRHDINQMRLTHDAAEQALMEQIDGLKQIHADELAARERASAPLSDINTWFSIKAKKNGTI